ncbi:hypothetical protein PG997_014982 [Apiospora hydei]|uniref:Uncharacterized protein n=1 Tax=Apiospora hydei TaxID=1337664 RepID=A0ABR1UXV3_9PEZI
MMQVLEAYVPHYELSLLDRMLLIWLFIGSAFVVVLQVSQSWMEPRPRWTVLDERSKPYWYTYYVYLAFLLVQISYRPLRHKMDSMQPLLSIGGFEVAAAALDGAWIGLLSLEALMIVFVLALQVTQLFGKAASPAAYKLKEL